MIKNKKFKYFSLFILTITIALLLFYFFLTKQRGKGVKSVIIREVDETNKWVMHTVSKLKRGNGSLASGDLNNDGKTDILLALGSRNDPQNFDGIWWLKAPKWKFNRISDPAYPIRWSLALNSADLDNDGDMDVISLSFDDSNVYLAINPFKQGGNIDKPWKTLKILESPGIHRDGERVDIADIDNDGYKDVIFLRGTPPEVHILLNPLGKISSPWKNLMIGIHGGTDAHDVIAKDIDKDGDLDLITASGDRTLFGDVYWFENPNKNHNSKWIRHKISTYSFNFGGLQIDDIDSDGYPDVLATEAHAKPGQVMWYKNPGKVEKKWVKYIIDKHHFPHAALALDVDGDGKNEFWIPASSPLPDPKFGGIVYYKTVNIKNNEWIKHIIAKPPAYGRQAKNIDMDGDGDMDILFVGSPDQFDSKILWLENKL